MWPSRCSRSCAPDRPSSIARAARTWTAPGKRRRWPSSSFCWSGPSIDSSPTPSSDNGTSGCSSSPRPKRRIRARRRAETPQVTTEMKDAVARLVRDLPTVWHDPRTPARERKRMLRLLIEDVTLDRGDVLRLSIRWKGGATSVVERPLPRTAPDLRRTPTAIVECVRALATEHTDGEIARHPQRPVAAHGDRQAVHLQARPVRAPRVPDHQLRGPSAADWMAHHPADGRVAPRASRDRETLRPGRPRARRARRRQGHDSVRAAHRTASHAASRKRFRDRRLYPQLASHRQKGVQYEA